MNQLSFLFRAMTILDEATEFLFLAMIFLIINEATDFLDEAAGFFIQGIPSPLRISNREAVPSASRGLAQIRVLFSHFYLPFYLSLS